MIPWDTITGIADLVVMAPAAFVILIWLFMAGEKRLALRWLALFSAGLGVVVATKMAFIGWGLEIRSLEFTGLSGHAMRAAAVIPVMSYLILQKSSPTVRTSGVLLGFALALLIAISRVAIHAHSVSEVVSGYLLGLAVSVGFLLSAQSLRQHVLNGTRLALSMTVLLMASCAGPAPTERWLTKATLYVTGHDRAFKRPGLKSARPVKPDPALL